MSLPTLLSLSLSLDNNLTSVDIIAAVKRRDWDTTSCVHGALKSVNTGWSPISSNPVTSHRQDKNKTCYLQSTGRFQRRFVPLDSVHFAGHDVLETVRSGTFTVQTLRVPIATIRVPVFSQGRRQHQPELVTCQTQIFIKSYYNL